MNDDHRNTSGASCPLPHSQHTTVQLAHGSGGKLTNDLIRSLLLRQFDNDLLRPLEDQARLTVDVGKLAFTTDSFVVDPIFFPGGNIGDLAVNGTINDICMCGATPLYLSVGLIIEEGLPFTDLEKIITSMSRASNAAGVRVVTGDTKVVDKGKADKIFINTSGIGLIEHQYEIGAGNLRVDDAILVSGSIANHGMAIISQRQELGFESEIESDTASLHPLVRDLLAVCGGQIHAMRDATRGGLAAVLNEFAAASGVTVRIDEGAIPIKPPVSAACEILGFDPLLVANEGVMIIAVESGSVRSALEALKNHSLGNDAALIGRVISAGTPQVILRTALGTERFVDLPVAAQLPRIC